MCNKDRKRTKAFVAFLEEHEHKLLGLARQLLSNNSEQDALDFVQDLSIRLWLKQKFNPTHPYAFAYARRAARYLFHDRQKRLARRPSVSSLGTGSEEDEPSPAQEFADSRTPEPWMDVAKSECHSIVHSAITHLKPQDQDVIHQRLADQTLEEIAQHQPNGSLGGVAGRYYRSLDALRDWIGDDPRP
jgi:RNA polymerase sigma factor (sigma-70 family)